MMNVNQSTVVFLDLISVWELRVYRPCRTTSTVFVEALGEDLPACDTKA